MRRRQVVFGLAISATSATAWRPAWSQDTADPSHGADGPAIGRALQRINAAYGNSIESLPYLNREGVDYSAVVAELSTWVQSAEGLIAEQTTALAAVPPLRGETDSVRRQALRTQRDAVRRLSEAYPLLVGQIRSHAAAGPQALERNANWYRTAYFDSHTLAVRVQREMIMAYAILVDQPVMAAAMRVLGHSCLIVLDLLGIFRSTVFGTAVQVSRLPASLNAAARDMRIAIGETQALAAVDGVSADWASFCEEELIIAAAAERLSALMLEALRERDNDGLSEQVALLSALFANRTARTRALDETFVA